GAYELVQYHCDRDGLLEKIVEVLEGQGIDQVILLSTLTADSIMALQNKVAKDDACQKAAAFQVDLAAAGQRATTQLKDVSDTNAQMKKRIGVLKSVYGMPELGPDLLPPVDVWKKLNLNPGTYIDFRKDLLPLCRPSEDLARSVNVDIVVNDVPQHVSFSSEQATNPKRSTMGGASWMLCFQRYSVALLLAMVDPRENAAPKDVDPFMLQEVDVRFRKFVSHAYLEASVSLRKLFDDSIKFRQIKLDCRLAAKDKVLNSSPTEVAGKRDRSDDTYKACSKNKRRFGKGLCYDFLAGKCQRGDNCKFMHSKPDSAKNQASRAAKDNKKLVTSGSPGQPSIISDMWGLASKTLKECEEKQAEELLTLVDGMGVDSVVNQSRVANRSSKVEALGEAIQRVVGLISASHVGEEIRNWISLSRDQQAQSHMWEDVKSELHSYADSLRREWAQILKVSDQKVNVGGDIRAPLMKAVLQAMQEETDRPLDYPFMDLVDSGIPLGTTCDVPPTKCWKDRSEPSKHTWYPVTREVWTNYISAEDFAVEVKSALARANLAREVSLGRMEMIGSNEVHRIQGVNRLACIPTCDDAGRLKKVRLVDDFRRSGINSVIDPHLSQTLVLPTIRSVALTAQYCVLEAQARGDSSPLLWLESDVKSAFRILRIKVEDTWYCTNVVDNQRYRNLALAFGAQSASYLFVRLSANAGKIVVRILQYCNVYSGLVLYIDDRGCPTTVKTALTTILVAILVDLLCGIDISWEKLFCSRQPRCLGYCLDLHSMRLLLPEDKRRKILEALKLVGTSSVPVEVSTIDTLLGRLVWASTSFCRLRCHLRPFFSTIKVARKKNLKRVWIGKALKQAAGYIGRVFESLCASPFNSLVPSMGCRRAIIMCDASTVALGGVILRDSTILWYHVVLSSPAACAMLAAFIPGFEDSTTKVESSHVCFLELLACLLGILSLPLFTSCLVISDNSAAVQAVCRHRAKAESMAALMRRFVVLRPDTTTESSKAMHVNGVANTVADLVSRSSVIHAREFFATVPEAREIDVYYKMCELMEDY
ncbi:hypothetical protein FOL47_000254, partial [Perkinsus chesapeaki]